MPTTHPATQFTPAGAYPDSQYLVAEQLPWSGARRPAVILVASDGTERSDGALRVALARALATSASIEILTVARWEPLTSPDGMTLWQEDNATRRGGQRRAVEAQLVRVTGKPREHGVTVLDGNPAFTISRVAIERRAALVIVGLGRHGLTDRLFSDETAIQLARISRVPVLAVPEHAVGSAWHAIVAVDFGEISDRAAQCAIDTVGDEGIVELVHVMPYIQENAFAVDGVAPSERWAHSQLDALAARLVVPAGVTLKSIAIHGSTAHALLDHAKSVDANLIATGTHGRGFVARAVLGSVATRLLRGSHCAVLSVPRDPLPALEPAERETVGLAPRPAPAVWVELLSAFSKRNAGRRTILEVDDIELGAQAQEYNYPLLGTVYEERAGRVELMLGDGRSGGRHLSRSIGNVAAVDVLTDGEGHDVALRIQHGASQTLLTFAA
ncbi:MAG: universal stress protein [Gemmatimonadaceae bacterium]